MLTRNGEEVFFCIGKIFRRQLIDKLNIRKISLPAVVELLPTLVKDNDGVDRIAVRMINDPVSIS
jgi:hypothetical protein